MEEFNKEENYRNQAIGLLANIPDNKSDDNPDLIKNMQETHKRYFDECKLRGPRRAVVREVENLEREINPPEPMLITFEGSSYTIDDKPTQHLNIPEIALMEIDCIDEQVHKLTRFNIMLLSSENRIKLRRYLQFLEDQKRRISKPIKTHEELTFEDLFFKQETAEKVDRIFKENGYTKDGQWIDSEKKRRIATAFYVLKDEYPEINVIRSGNHTSQLRVFCKHYGIITNDNTMKNLRKRPEYEKEKKTDYIEFMTLFYELK